MIRDNIEALSVLRIPDYPGSRVSGLSAMLRVKDEGEWLGRALESIAGWCDEIVIAVQGEQVDETRRIAETAARTDPKRIRALYYPFDSRPNGPGHADQPHGSVRERAYFYNWTLGMTTRSHVIKWDGDMVALDDTAARIRAALDRGHDFIRFEGVEIVDAETLKVSATHPAANIETRVFPARADVHFATGSFCEMLIGLPSRDRQVTLADPAYLHFKWAKSAAAATKAWPDNWRDLDHFRRIAARAEPGRRYRGPVPACLRSEAAA